MLEAVHASPRPRVAVTVLPRLFADALVRALRAEGMLVAPVAPCRDGSRGLERFDLAIVSDPLPAEIVPGDLPPDPRVVPGDLPPDPRVVPGDLPPDPRVAADTVIILPQAWSGLVVVRSRGAEDRVHVAGLDGMVALVRSLGDGRLSGPVR